MSADDLDDFELYAIPDADDHPATIAAELMKLPEHRLLKEHDIHIEFLFHLGEIKHGGKFVLGMVHEPIVQGRLKDLFIMLLVRFFGGLPHYIIVLSKAYWDQATPLQREALVFHELMHIKQEKDQYGAPKFKKDGSPSLTLVAHDIEEFNSVVNRYGAWKPDIQQFIDAYHG